MGDYLTAEEVKQKNLNNLGSNLGSLYHELCNELAWLYIKWEQYIDLFGKKPSRIALLNRSAPLFFRIVQDTLWEDVLLHITRLTDPPKSSGKNNLSIQCLPSLVDETVKEKVVTQITDAKKKTEFSRDWRNRHIAHRDQKLAIGEQSEPLKPASRAAVKDALDSIAKTLNIISIHYMKSEIRFDFMSDVGGAEDLLYILDDGIRVDTERRNRFEEGRPLPEDLKERVL